MAGIRTGLIVSAAAVAASALGAAQAGDLRIVQTNSRDSVIHLIDPETHSIVGTIEDVPVNHGVAAAPDGSRLYFSSEAKETLDVFDVATMERIAEIPLPARPHNISISPDGARVYVGLMGAAFEDGFGGIQVIDTQALAPAALWDTNSRVHNTYVTKDGRYVVASMFGGEQNLGVFDAQTGELAWGMYPPRNEGELEGVRPIAFETNADGSTRRLFVQISDFHGFTVVDFETQEELTRIELPERPAEKQEPGPYTQAPAHGIGVSPDGRTLWVCSRVNGEVYAYSVPELDYLGFVEVGSHPDWLTFTPDSRFVYVANGHSDDVSVIDIAAIEEVARLPVGAAPKRNITMMLPD